MRHATLPLLAAALLAPSALAQQLIAVDSSRALYELDMTTGARTQIGTVSSNAATTGGLARDPVSGTIYVSSTSNDSLYTLDLVTGTATLVGPYGDTAIVMHGIEYDSSTGTLYGVSSHNNGLYNIDKTTGAATLIGTSGLSSFTNLGYDSIANVMYATNSGQDSFYSMDRATGAVTLIGPLTGPTNPNGLAFDSDGNRLFLVCNSTDTLYTIDRNTGLANPIGSVGSSNLLGLVYIPSSSPAPVNYCTGGTTTNGCVASISASGTPSAAATSGFTLTASNVEGQKQGLIFYSITGRQAAQWGTGSSFLCVKSPTQRLPSQTSGGTTGACDGTLSNDWLAYIAGNPGAVGAPISAGQVFQAQAWFRDPPAAKSTSLSNAIEFTLAP